MLEECGGYSLSRLDTNSHTLIEIDSLEGGITVPFLNKRHLGSSKAVYSSATTGPDRESRERIARRTLV